MDDKCKHENTDNGYCIECGICVEDLVVYDYKSYDYQPPSALRSSLLDKYIVKQNRKLYIKEIKQILVPMQLEQYSSAVEEILSKSTFKNRLSVANKVIVILYSLLKEDAFPVTMEDLLKFTEMRKSALLKAYRNAFIYSSTDACYNQGIYEVCADEMRIKKVEYSFTQEEFKILRGEHPSADPKMLCLAGMIANASQKKYLSDLYPGETKKIDKIRKIIYKLKKYINKAV
ncbi:hypothetical protein ENBRE01_1901 [Enteropsectra breve]|nr:hypothetical protein ENBRE01_1901 [Enteropsectra breve]